MLAVFVLAMLMISVIVIGFRFGWSMIGPGRFGCRRLLRRCR